MSVRKTVIAGQFAYLIDIHNNAGKLNKLRPNTG